MYIFLQKTQDSQISPIEQTRFLYGLFILLFLQKTWFKHHCSFHIPLTTVFFMLFALAKSGGAWENT